MDFDDAYANMAHIPDARSFIAKWPERAAAFRANWPQKQLDIAYGDDPRQRFDLFLPDGVAKGLAVFIHGGYWRAFAKGLNSDVRSKFAGPLERVMISLSLLVSVMPLR